MVVGEDDDNVLHSLSKQKKAKLKPKHSLNYSVERNIPSAKNTNKIFKHYKEIYCDI